MSSYHLINYNSMESVDLCVFLKDRYHGSINQSKKVLIDNIDAWMQEYSKTHNDWELLYKLIVKTCQDIEDHLRKKETIFYPFVEVISKFENVNENKYSLVKNPINKMVAEQNQISNNISKIRQMTHNEDIFVCKNKICILCLTELFELEQQLSRLFHIEQSILFQKLMSLEEHLN